MDWRSVKNAKVIRADIKTHALLSRSSKDIMLTYVLFMVVIQCPFPQFADWLGKYSADVGPVIGYHKSDISKYACSPKIVDFFFKLDASHTSQLNADMVGISKHLHCAFGEIF